MFDPETDLKKNFLKKVGRNVKKLRGVAALSQFELAVEAGIPKNQIGRIERGEIPTPPSEGVGHSGHSSKVSVTWVPMVHSAGT